MGDPTFISLTAPGISRKTGRTRCKAGILHGWASTIIVAMAQQTVTTMVDDIDGSTEDVVTCAFGLGDSHFEIDLNVAHREELESVLAKFVEAARPVHSGKASRPVKQVKRAAVDRDRTHQIREWARTNGYEVSERGRIAKNIVDAYDAAN
jgi:hypothetical protein